MLTLDDVLSQLWYTSRLQKYVLAPGKLSRKLPR